MDANRFAHLVGGGGKNAGPSPARFFTVLVIVMVLLVGGSAFLSAYTDWLWFLHDAQQPAVFAKTFWTRSILWLIAFVVALGLILFNVFKALNVPLVYSDMPEEPQARMAANALGNLQRFGRLVGIVLSAVVALGVAGNVSGQYREFWNYRYRVDFGVNDPVFGRDLGYYVFTLPWLQTLVGALVTVLLFSGVVCAGIYFGTRALAKLARVQTGEAEARMHLSVLAAAFLIVFGFQLLLNRYGLLTTAGAQFTGPGFALSKSMTAWAVTAYLTILLGILTAVNARLWKPYIVPTYGGPGVLVFGLLAVGIYPGIVQRFTVDPNRINVEAPFVERAIKMTRLSFGIDRTDGRSFEVRDFEVQAAPTPAEVAASESTLKNMRLWDPTVLQRTIENIQALKPYYTFHDVDIDRYTINGEPRMVMLAARDIFAEGLSPNARNWVNQTFQYTHGFGLVMATSNESTRTGRPEFLIRDIPPISSDSGPFKIEQPRLYFGDYSVGSLERNGYLLLRSKVEEFDYPDATDRRYRWTGKRGVPIGGSFAKLLYSMQFGDGSIVVTPNLQADSRILYRRDIRDRAGLVYPMLKFDSDPYAVLFKGRVLYILDAYTTSDLVPYSAHRDGPQGVLNYIRNSVKVVIDAYSGDMTAYAVDETDPLLRVFMRTFPGLVRPATEIPDGLKEHFRYGEDMFMYQAFTLTQYHVTDSKTFLNNEDAWEIPTEIGRDGNRVEILPYYVQIRLPGESRDAFLLILPFTPREKNNMIGWMAAHCDPADFGEVVLYKFPTTSSTPGPIQMEATFNADAQIAEINRQFNNDQSEIVPGNLLVVPIGSSILYVKPIFLQSRINPIPELRKVILGLPNNRVVVANTYEEALERLLGEEAAAAVPSAPGGPAEPAPSNPTGATPTDPALIEQVREGLRLLDQADEALRAGDFARYGELQRQAREKLRQIAP